MLHYTKEHVQRLDSTCLRSGPFASQVYCSRFLESLSSGVRECSVATCLCVLKIPDDTIRLNPIFIEKLILLETYRCRTSCFLDAYCCGGLACAQRDNDTHSYHEFSMIFFFRPDMLK